MFFSTKKRFSNTFVTLVFFLILAFPIYFEYQLRQSKKAEHKIALESAIRQFGFYLEEVSRESGIQFIHVSPELDPVFDPILPQIASMGASVSVSDFNNDGWNDLYVTNSRYSSKNALYLNQKDGSFTDVAGQYGLDDLNIEGTGVSMGAVWADYNNDGYEDLFVYKWGKPELFRNDQGNGFTRVTEKIGLPDWINSNAAIWLDYNADGNIDLFIGGYFPEDVDLWNITRTDILTESFEYALNGGRNYLLENTGNGVFADVTIKTGLTSTRWTLAAGAADINQDGFPELIIANDYGIDEFYFNNNGNRFTEAGDATTIGFSPKSGMNVSFGDTYNTGQFGIYISNITEEGILLQGNNFWVPIIKNNKILYQNLARQQGIETGGWSYGAQFGDLNNDGSMDIYVANGFISGKKGTTYWYDYSKVTGGNSAIISDIKNWPAMKGRSQSGYQQNKIWLNEGSGYFFDVADYVTDNLTYDSRAVAMADLWNRGVLDVVVANQNNRLLVYKNHVNPENHWITFTLEGSGSNKSAIGAIIRLYWDSKSQSQIVSGGIGFSSQNQRRIHFGIGRATKVEKAEILWPGGRKQRIEHPEINTVHKIIESE
ncbi:MAG: CRTAC1 family protein [Bacteroidales bacterium]|nr:CRTAC1 family protein [Bacteroidales bacterium]